MPINDINSLSHTKWNCKYHIVFAPKYRRRVFFHKKKVVIGKILRQLCEWKDVTILEAETIRTRNQRLPKQTLILSTSYSNPTQIFFGQGLNNELSGGAQEIRTPHLFHAMEAL